jgi:ketosteroid isomerase-like protein
MMPTLEERVQRLEDIEDIRRLKIRYAELCDAHYDDPDGLAALFTDDAVWDGGSDFGVYQGKQAIRAFFAGVSKQITFALHYMIGHAIDIAPSGHEASGTCYLWMPATLNGRAVWLAATYDNRYRKVGGQWLFSQVKVTVAFMTPYETGWVQERVVSS